MPYCIKITNVFNKLGITKTYLRLLYSTEPGTIMEFKCCLCPKTYKIKMCLTNHVRMKHGNPKQYQCTNCEYLTSNKGHWETHIRSQHEHLKEPCDVCGKEFSNRSNVYRHKRKLNCKQTTFI